MKFCHLQTSYQQQHITVLLTTFETILQILTMSSIAMTFDISASVLNRVSETYKEFGIQITRTLGNKFGFDAEEAIEELGLNQLSISKKKAGPGSKKVSNTGVKKTKTTAPKKNKPACPLPFVGTINEENCKGIRVNNCLHTQCLNDPIDGEHEYCNTCQKQASANASGKPNTGDIRDRLECDILEFVDPKGRKTMPYINVVNKLKLDIDECKAEADKFGIEIPECHFEERLSVKGRPKKSDDGSTLSSASSTTSGEKKSRGRPRKVKEVVSVVEDDLLSALVANVSGTHMDDDNKTVTETEEPKKVAKKVTKKAPAPKKTIVATPVTETVDIDEEAEAEADKAKALKAKKAADAKAKREVVKAKKLADAQAKAEQEAQALKAKKEEEEAKALKAKADAEEETKELEEEDDEDEEESIEVEEFTLDGKKYMKDSGNLVYDPSSGDLIGEFNPETGVIDEVEFADSDGEEE